MTQIKKNLGVIFGGRSGEHEVSLMSARSVLDAIDREKYNIIEIGITREGQWLCGENVHDALQSGKTSSLFPVTLLPIPGSNMLYAMFLNEAGYQMEPFSHLDVVFPVLHGSYGEDGTLQGFLEMASIAYVGAGVLGSSLGMDKGVFKEIMRANDIPVANWVVLTNLDIQNDFDQAIRKAEAVADYPLFVKPANLGSSVGVTKCHNRSDLLEGILDAIRYDRRILVEQGINAREIEVSVLGNTEPKASLPGEIRPGQNFYSYDAKYLDDSTDLDVPAKLDKETIQRLQELAVKSYKLIDCAGMGRVDFLVDKDTSEVFLSEINTIPGFTRISMYPKLWAVTGITYAELIDRLIDLALERHAETERLVRSYGEVNG